MEPIKVELEVGKVYWWSSRPGIDIWEDEDNVALPNLHFDATGPAGCDHFTADRTEAYICTCKQTKSPPYCDGSHKQLSDVSG